MNPHFSHMSTMLCKVGSRCQSTFVFIDFDFGLEVGFQDLESKM